MKQRSPWSWVPTLYFAEGIPYVIVMTVSVIMYKRFGLSNTEVALYTSWLYLPWVIKPFWSPFVDLIKTKRWWITAMQLLIGAGLGAVAFLIPAPFFLQATLAVFWLIAFSSATHDIAADGFYMLALDDSQQSFFVGIRSTFYRFAMIAGQGLLIMIAGFLESSTGMNPIEFTVQSSNSLQTSLTDTNTNNSGDGETFVLSSSMLTINNQNISSDSLVAIKNFALQNNQANGFVDKDIVKYNTPAGNELTGNAGLLTIKLAAPPKDENDVILNTEFAKGDKSISIISGERLIFNQENWDKQAYIVVQLDKKLTTEVSASFKGTAGNVRLAWSITFFIIAGLFIALYVYHRFILPYPDSDKTITTYSGKDVLHEFGLTFKTFFQKEGIGIALAFMLLYRLGEALLVKMSSPFLLDSRDIGGLALTTGQVGLVYGTIGVVALTLGGIIGGIAISRKGLKYWLWPMALSITRPNLAYLYLSWYQPESFLLINTAVALEQFGYGFGFTAYMIYLIYFSDGEHKTAHYAICTGFMALGMMLPGMAAGWLQELVGYNNFFMLIVLCTIPTLAVIPFIKVDKNFGVKQKTD